MNYIPGYTTLADFLVDNDISSNQDKRTQLVRILSRSSTLPKVKNILINIETENTKGFYINPGKSISIGAYYLSKPVAALLCLRYGLEWQIWYHNQSESKNLRICDIAACRVAAKFHDLTPKIDKISIDNIPQSLADNILKFKENDEVSAVIEQLDFEALAVFHQQEISTTAVEQTDIDTLNCLASPVEYLMMSGGDLRLKVDPDRLLNKYGCRPFPRPEAFTFASSTASSISNNAYNKAQFKRIELIKESFANGLLKTFQQFSEKIKNGLKKHIYIPNNSEIILASSGTDVSLQIAAIAQTVFNKKVTHILLAADETGSGVPAALKGRHFSNSTAQDIEVKKGELIESFEEGAQIRINLRNEEGVLKHHKEVDEEAFKAVERVIVSGKQPVLHIMDQSKLGYKAPSKEGLKKIEKAFDNQILYTVDNSQLRMDSENVRDYINRGYLMTLTGSKFFTGPPFNGALIIPEKRSVEWSKIEIPLPEGMSEYSYLNDWPDWKMTAPLKEGINPGVLMRWYASLTEIKRYYDTPASLRYIGIDLFCEHVEKTINHTEFLESITEYEEFSEEEKKHISIKDRKTIFPFFIKKDGKVLNKQQIDTLYRLLNKDLSEEFKDSSDDMIRLAAQACHIGQPVAARYKDGTESGVVRINLGARVISESWKERDSSMFFKIIEEQMIQVNLIIQKIKLIVNKPELWKTD